MKAPTIRELRDARAAMGGLPSDAAAVLRFEAMCRAYVESMLDDEGIVFGPRPLTRDERNYPEPRPNRIPFVPPNPDRPR